MGKERLTYGAEFKFNCVMELISGQKTMSQLCREHVIKDSVIARWREQFLTEGHEVFEPKNGQNQEQGGRVAELERLLGQLTIQLEASKKASSWLKCR